MDVIEVGDAADPRLADFRDLTDADVRPDRRGIVIAEGVNVVERMARSPYRMRAVVGVPSRLDALREVVPSHVPVFAVDKWTLSDVVGFRVTRGVMASADRGAPPQLDALLKSARRVAVLESLNDFENLGALFRNAAAFGVDAVLLDPYCADPLYRRSVRVSMGHVLRVPFAVLPSAVASPLPPHTQPLPLQTQAVPPHTAPVAPHAWVESLDLLRAHGFGVYALTPAADAVPLRDVVPSPRWAVLLGAEGPGLSAAALAAADQRVRIPMADGVDSLNVATAAAVAFAHLAG